MDLKVVVSDSVFAKIEMPLQSHIKFSGEAYPALFETMIFQVVHTVSL